MPISKLVNKSLIRLETQNGLVHVVDFAVDVGVAGRLRGNETQHIWASANTNPSIRARVRRSSEDGSLFHGRFDSAMLILQYIDRCTSLS